MPSNCLMSSLRSCVHALPRLRIASSSVDQECELASSFARLRMLAGHGTSRLDVDIAPSVGTASFPPGVLLPLIDELLGSTADGGSVDISFATFGIATADVGDAANSADKVIKSENA